MTCPGHEECRRRFEALEKRLEKADEAWERVEAAVTELKVGLANLNGRIAGYLIAACLLGTIVAFIAQKVLG